MTQEKGPFKLYKIESGDRHAFYTVAETEEDATSNLTKHLKDGQRVEAVDRSILVLPPNAIFMNAAEADELTYAFKHMQEAVLMSDKLDAKTRDGINAALDQIIAVFKEKGGESREQEMNRK